MISGIPFKTNPYCMGLDSRLEHVGTMENYQPNIRNNDRSTENFPIFTMSKRYLRGFGDGRGRFFEEVPTCAGALPGPHAFWHQAQLFLWKLVGFVGKTLGIGTVSLLNDQH